MKPHPQCDNLLCGLEKSLNKAYMGEEEEERHSWQDYAGKGNGCLVPEGLRSHAEGLGLNPESKRNLEGEMCPDVHFTKTTWDVCRVWDVGHLQVVLEAFEDLGS